MRIKPKDYERAILSISTKIYDNEIPATNDIDIVLHAAKKQIGKKVVMSARYNSYRCPCCDGVMNISQHYCSQCGQKIDWQ